MDGLRYEPGIGGRKGKWRATERARLTDFDGSGTGVQGAPEGWGKAAEMCSATGDGGSVAEVGTEMEWSVTSIDCLMCGDRDRIAD